MVSCETFAVTGDGFQLQTLRIVPGDCQRMAFTIHHSGNIPHRVRRAFLPDALFRCSPPRLRRIGRSDSEGVEGIKITDQAGRIGDGDTHRTRAARLPMQLKTKPGRLRCSNFRSCSPPPPYRLPSATQAARRLENRSNNSENHSHYWHRRFRPSRHHPRAGRRSGH